MYFNDVHILYYVLFGTLALVIAQIVEYCSKAFIEDKKIFKKETFTEYARKSYT